MKIGMKEDMGFAEEMAYLVLALRLGAKCPRLHLFVAVYGG